MKLCVQNISAHSSHWLRLLHSMSSTFPRSSVLILGPNSIHSLLPTTIISQVESLLESHLINDAVGLVDQQRKKIEGNLKVDNDEVRSSARGIKYICIDGACQLEALH